MHHKLAPLTMISTGCLQGAAPSRERGIDGISPQQW
jgi:hypothetical protein